MRCSQITSGRVIEVKDRGAQSPVILVVSYEVAGKVYSASESEKYASSTIKVCGFPVGQKRTPKLGRVFVGSTVRVSYDPSHPETAYLTDNVGWMNVLDV